MQTQENFYQDIEKILENVAPERHSYFQLKYFLIGKEPTLQSKMWQAIRELKSRKDSLDSIDLEIEETKDKIELIDISKQKLALESNSESFKNKTSDEQELSIRELIVKNRQLDRQKTSLQKKLSSLDQKIINITEECVFFVDVFKNLEKIESLKHFDDLESQKNYWNEKLTQKFNLKALTTGIFDSEMMETILALPDDVDVKKNVVSRLNARHLDMLNEGKKYLSEGK